MMVALIIAAVLESQNESRIHTILWLGMCYIGGEMLISKAICWRELNFKAFSLRSKVNHLPMSTADKGE